MPVAILAVLQWILANPDVLIKGEAFVVQLITDAIKVWNSFKDHPGKTEEQMQAEWQKLGIDIQAVRDDWRTRHPITTDTGTG